MIRGERIHRTWFLRLRLALVLGLPAILVVVRLDRYWQQKAALGPLGKYIAHVSWDIRGYVESLELSVDNSVREDELENLKELSGLRRLWIHVSDCGRPGERVATDVGLSHLSGLTSLEALTYEGPSVTDAGLRHLAGLQSLESLLLPCSEASDEGLKSFGNLDRLRRLCLLNGPALTGEGLVYLPQPLSLRKLSILHVTDGGIRTMTRFSELRDLTMNGDRLTHQGVRSLQEFHHLEQLYIWDAPLDNRGLEKWVGPMTGLTKLRISKCPLTGDALRHLQTLKELEVLEVEAEGIDDRSVPFLIELPRLAVLDLRSTAITDASLPALLRLHTLKMLCVPFRIQLTGERRKEFLEALPKLHTLRSPDGDVTFEGWKRTPPPDGPLLP
jgi:hypothetical protein